MATVEVDILGMRKITSFIVNSSFVLLVLPLAVLAQDSVEPGTGAAKPELQQKREVFRQEVKQKQEAVKQGIQERKDTLKQNIQERKDILKQNVQERKDALKQGVQEKKEVRKEIRDTRATVRQEVREKRKGVRAEVEKKREEFKQKVEERKDELKKKLGEKRAVEIERFFANMARKFEEAVNRLDVNADKISTHLDKAAANGRDVSVPHAKLEEARGKIAEAEKAFEDAKARYAEAVKDPDFKASFAKVRSVVQGVEQKIKEAHRALVDVIKSLKGLGKVEKPAVAPETTVVPTPTPVPTT